MRHRSLRPGIGAHLLVVAAVPALLAGGLAVEQSSERRAEARVAATVGADVTSLAQLVDARSLLAEELILSNVLLAGSELGVPVATLEQFLGVPIVAQLAETRNEVGALPSAIRAMFEDITELRPAVDAGSIPQREHALRSDAVMGSFDTALDDLADDLVRRSAGLSGSSSLLQAVDDLVVLRAAVGAATSEMDAAFRVLTQPGDAGALARLFALDQRFAEISERLGSSRSATQVRDAWASFGTVEDVVAFEATVDGLLAPLRTTEPTDTAAPFDVTVLGPVFESGLTRVRLLTDVLAEAAAHAVREADRAVGRIEAEQDRFAVFVGVALLLGATAVAVVAAGIARPLVRLARSARALRSGDLDADLARPGGPRQVLVVGRAVEELAGTLRVVQDQAEALAAGRLEDETVAAAVPGRLGAAVQASFRRLSAALAEQRSLREVLEHAATHDALTGLPNRAAALRALDVWLTSADTRAPGDERATPTGADTALLFCDLDGFKAVNDRFGHPVGDAVLQEAAARMANTVREGDVVARFGGDEFLVIAGGLDGADAAASLARRLVERCSQPYATDAGAAVVGMSVGVAVHRAGESPVDAREMLRRADIALARTQDADRGGVRVFDGDLRRLLAEEDDLRVALRAAIRDDELELHYQPVVDTADGRLVSLEALVRWTRPGLGPVPPSAFVPIAERSDLILDLDRWVVAAAARQLAAWRDHPLLRGVGVAVNLSARHLAAASFGEDVVRPLVEHDVDPSLLCVEVTEGVMVGDITAAAERLAAVRASGVRVAVDDFGTGFTSIANLRQMPVDVLKIDRSIVASPTEGDRSILALLARVGATLGQVVVAEGVEGPDDVRRAIDAGCGRLQGWAIARAVPPAALEELVASWPDRCAPQVGPLVGTRGTPLT